MRQISASRLRIRSGEVLDHVQTRGPVRVTRYGRVVAFIIPAEVPQYSDALRISRQLIAAIAEQEAAT